MEVGADISPPPGETTSGGGESLVGTWILDQYRITGLIGHGGMGRVYAAEQVALDRKVAIKILSVAGSAAQQRFRNEARAASRLVHPNIVTVFNFGELADGSLFIAMEFLDGPPLFRVLGDGRVALARAIDIVEQCAAALDCAHVHGIVHRDFKPHNVVLTPGPGTGEHVKVVDFGLARWVEETGETPAGIVLGTPQYLSPEQCRGEQATALSDQYALGLVFYELITGRPAFSAETALNYIHQHQFESFPPPSELRRDRFVELFDPVVSRMTAKDPAGRYMSFMELHRALSDLRATISEVRPERASGYAEDARLGRPRSNLAPSPDRRAREARVSLRGSKRILAEGERDLLLRSNVRVHPESKIGAKHKGDLWIVGGAENAWTAAREELTEGGISPLRAIACIDAPPDSNTAIAAVTRLSNLILSAHPVDSLPLAMALRWIDGGHNLSLIEAWAPGGVQLLQVPGSKMKPYLIDSLNEDLEAEQIRSVVRLAVTAIAEEMLMNAIFHAPVDASGRRLFSHLARDVSIALKPEQQPVLRWGFDEQFIGVSIRDPFGSMSSTEMSDALGRVGPSPQVISGGGAGLGLQIMRRASCHLFFAILPGKSTEVFALVERNRTESSHLRRSLSVLQGATEAEERIGDRLWMREIRSAKLLRFELRGDINESSDLTVIFQKRGTVWLDLGGVRSINSGGMAAWIRANTKREPELHLMFERCSPALVYQFGMVRDFTASGEVLSVLAPYECDGCGREVEKRIEVTAMRGLEPPPQSCPTCGRGLRLQDTPESYFAFLASR